MKLLNRIEKSLGRYAIPRMTIYIVFLQSLAFVLRYGAIARNPEHGGEVLNRLSLNGNYVLQEPWRLISFLVIPPTTNPIFFFVAMYLLFLMGTALENHWGAFRYNLFLLVGWLATVVVALALRSGSGDNAPLMLSIFLAFAFLYPEFQLLLFFVLPVKVKWLAIPVWVLYVYQFCIGDWLGKSVVLAAVANFLLFFHKELWMRAKAGHRRMQNKVKSITPDDNAFNRCTLCGVTEKSDPRMEFRYCPQCAGTLCYCINHIHAHEHRITPTPRVGK